MIQLTNDIWIGDSTDEQHADLATPGISAVLNVAQDLQPTRGWKHGLEYMQVGLVDGPGNPPAAYKAAVLALVALLERSTDSKVMICCHTGGRSLAVGMIYMSLVVKHGWDDLLEILRERLDIELPEPNEAHRKAFDKIMADHVTRRFLASHINV